MKFLVIFVAVIFSHICHAQRYVAEVVWIEREGTNNHIYFSGFDGEDWVLPKMPVYTSDNPLSSPVLGTSFGGQKILIWSEQKRLKTVLMFKQVNTENWLTNSEQPNWTEASLFSDLGLENMAPSIVFDVNNQAWVFWSASNRKPSDVYLTKLIGLQWTEPEKVNKDNEVPDVLPLATVNQSGNVVVNWQTFDLITGDYIVDSREYLVDTQRLGKISSQTQLSEADIRFPEFIQAGSRVLLHFPSNRYHQSVLLQ